jgi:aspartate/methionine/tyrosine aminotransferase
VNILKQSGFGVVPPAGTYFVMTDLAAWAPASDIEFCRYLTTEIGVAAIPPTVFYAQPESAPIMARFCFAKALTTLEAAATRLARLPQQTAQPTSYGRAPLP